MQRDAYIEQLIQSLKGYVPEASNDELGKIAPYCDVVPVGAGDILHRAGDTDDSIFFVNKGLLRFYYITEDGKEHNKSFSIENQFAGGLSISDQSIPTRYFIQAMEESQVLRIPLNDLNGLFSISHTWANLGRIFMESVAVRKSLREAEFLLDSAETRYREFNRLNPELTSRLPLYHITSYLGITDVALSRIRKRIADQS